MFQVTVYIEAEGEVEKLTESFDSMSARNDWLIQQILTTNFQYLIVNGEPITNCNPFVPV